MGNITNAQKAWMTAPVRDNIKPYIRINHTIAGSGKNGVFTSEDKLKSFTIERVGDETKFFGYGIIQKANFKIIGLDEMEIYQYFDTQAYIQICFDWNGVTYRFAHTPSFWVSEVHRDAVTGEVSVTAYDRLYRSTSKTLNNEGSSPTDDLVNKSVEEMLNYIAEGLHDVETPSDFYNIYMTPYLVDLDINEVEFPAFTWNIEGSETYRDILDDVAEVFRSVYYLDYNGSKESIRFKPIAAIEYTDIDLDLTKDDYFDCTIKSNRRFKSLTHATVLGNNITAGVATTGTDIYLRDNVILSGMDELDVATLIKMLADDYMYTDTETFPNFVRINGSLRDLSIGQFECTWRGNPFLEIGDALKVYDDEDYITTFVLNDVIEYNGTLKQKTQWNYKSEDVESASNPATLGEVLKQTYAHVDKVNQNISQVVHTQTEHEEQITSLVTEAGNISASVTTMQNGLEETLEGINGTFDTLTKKVEAAVTADDVQISIEKELSNGVDKVSTKTGYTFDEEGLTIAKSNSEMSTQITDDGMTVYRSGEAVLIANNEGVQAEDLHATTYLIIGNNSRFEDMGSDRTACFWIGG